MVKDFRPFPHIRKPFLNPHIWLCNRSHLTSYMRKLSFSFFISVSRNRSRKLRALYYIHPYPIHLSVISLLDLRGKVSLETMILHQISEYGEEKYPGTLPSSRHALCACALHAPVFWFIKRAKWAAVRPPLSYKLWSWQRHFWKDKPWNPDGDSDVLKSILETLILAKTFWKENPWNPGGDPDVLKSVLETLIMAGTSENNTRNPDTNRGSGKKHRNFLILA